ncbi:hypothetical protein GQ54DRAFT_131517 [Martensiomyces pterosporus]|nr:hypothetical protein GQ54DRAFT_131517 [Martensiomyces pterosporus]
MHKGGFLGCTAVHASSSSFSLASFIALRTPAPASTNATMALDSVLERNLDKVGGIIAAVVFAVCLFAHLWQLMRHRCYPLVATSIFLLLRVIGWLTTAVGAIQNKSDLNKRGYIVNSLAFWLMMLGGFLLIARWDASRRGVNWSTQSSVLSGVAFVVCVVFGGLEASGQISWLNNPQDNPKVTLNVSEAGFLALAVLYALIAGYFNVHEPMVYQKPGVRFSFYLTAAFLLGRCIFSMVVALRIVTFAQDKRQLFLFCLATTFEMFACAAWGFSAVARDLEPQDITPVGELPPSDDDYNSAQPVLTTSNAMHKLDNVPTRDSMYDGQTQPGSHIGKSQIGANAMYGSSGGGSYGNNPNLSSYNAAVASVPDETHGLNPWATVSSSNAYASGQHVGEPLAYAQQQQPMARQPLHLQTQGISSYAGEAGVSFAQQSASAYSNAPAPHSNFVKTPYPLSSAANANAHPRPSYADGGANSSYFGYPQASAQAPARSAYNYENDANMQSYSQQPRRAYE